MTMFRKITPEGLNQILIKWIATISPEVWKEMPGSIRKELNGDYHYPVRFASLLRDLLRFTISYHIWIVEHIFIRLRPGTTFRTDNHTYYYKDINTYEYLYTQANVYANLHSDEYPKSDTN